MVIGRPNIWSLGQAHYLLANLRNTNRDLSITSPTLNPNSINGARLNVLRTLIGAEAQVSTPQALQNRVAQQQFQSDFSRRQSAIARLDELTSERLQVIREISAIDTALAALGPRPEEENDRVAETERRRQELTQTRAAKATLSEALKAEIDIVKDRANKDVTLSNIKDELPLGDANSVSLPSEGLGDIKPLIEKMLENGIPNIDASQQLDNYINMQYELIAKQLTLLRDEVSSNERLIFLELPSSLYTVPDRDEDKMVHIEWTITELYRRCRSGVVDTLRPGAARTDAKTLQDLVFDAQRAVADVLGARAATSQRRPLTDEYISRFNELRRSDVYLNLVAHAIYADAYERLNEDQQKEDEPRISSDHLNLLNELGKTGFQGKYTERSATLRAEIDKFNSLSESDKNKTKELAEMILSYPELLTIGWAGIENTRTTSLLMHGSELQRYAQANREIKCIGETDQRPDFRVVDIIPRQSALNVNDVHATQKGFALAAKFLTLFGFGAQVSYQRQRTIYDQFINQDVFASGFGKGTDKFGWTIGPVPGTKRLAPGPRTTFAILAIPKDAEKITLQATAAAFSRTKDPSDVRARRILTPNEQPVSFDLWVPSEKTDGFFVDSIDYTPVRKGQRVTVFLGGSFSPLTGVIVDGIPLKRAVAIAKHESDSSTLPVAADSPGEYEYLNPRQLIISFTLSDDDFVGTPLITLVTPEKSTPINFFASRIKINGVRNVSLQDHSRIEPMFLDSLNITRVEIAPQYLNPAVVAGTLIPARLVGSGFRRGASICIGNSCAVGLRLRGPGLYEFRIDKPDTRVWTFTYRLGHEIASTSFDTLVDGVRIEAPTIDSIENPATGRPDGLPSGRYTVVIRGSNLQDVYQVRFGRISGRIRPTRHPNVLLVDVPPGRVGAVEVLLLAPEGRSNILDFATPGKAIFKYVKPEKPKPNPPSTP
jgi:hypothetical protein